MTPIPRGVPDPPRAAREVTGPQLLLSGPVDADVTVLLAHGAGAPMDSPFLEIVASELAARGVRVARFEFPYMAARRQTGVRRPPDRLPRLQDAYRAAIAALAVAPARLWLGGKSMGGRVATTIADESGCAGVFALGYPFHPPGRPDRTRVDHLATLVTPCLIVQGQRDRFGTPAEVESYHLSPSLHLVWIPEGDHSFGPTKNSGHSEDSNMRLAVDRLAAFLHPTG